MACKICGKKCKVYSRGMCNTCYSRWWRENREPELMKAGKYGWCEFCGEPLPRGADRFCSKKCYFAWECSLSPEANRVCKNCGKKFRTNPAYLKRRRKAGIFCSRDCYLEYRREHPSYSEDSAGYIVTTKGGKAQRVHRIKMEGHLGRKLRDDEHIHHKNGDKSDNRIENLTVMSAEEHHRLHTSKLWETKWKDRDRDKLFGRKKEHE